MRSEPLRLNEIVFEIIKHNLAEGRLEPGTIIRESDIARTLGVSRVPSRAALKRLEEQGLLVPAKGRGFVVTGTVIPGRVGKGASLDLAITDQQRDDLGQRNWRQRVFEQAELQLASAAVFGSFRTSEIALAEYYDFSRNVARELLGRLERIGVVRQRTNGRWHIEQLHEADVHDHYTMRRLLEPVALLEVASRIKRDSFRKPARKLLATLAAPAEVNMERIVEFERDLHVDIVLQTINKPLAEAIRRSQLPLISTHLAFVASHSPETISETVSEHLGIITALADGDAARAAAMLEQHLAQAEKTSLQRLTTLQRADLSFLPAFLTADV